MGLTAAHSQLVAQLPSPQTWRQWLSFLLAGLYAPAGASYQYQLAAHHAGKQPRAPTPPSGRGMVVLGLFVAVPSVMILIIGCSVSAAEVWWDVRNERWARLTDAYRFLLLNIPVAWFYAFGVVLARRNDRRYRMLLFEVTSGDSESLRTFAEGRTRRLIAAGTAFLPLLVVISGMITLSQVTWAYPLSTIGAFYWLVVAVAAWSSTWLQLDAFSRFRQAILRSSP